MNITIANLMTMLLVVGICLPSNGQQEKDRSQFSKLTLGLPSNSATRFMNMAKEQTQLLFVEWNDVKYPKNGVIEVSGTMYLKNEKTRVPVGWQAVRVLVERRSGSEIDWTRGHSQTTAVWNECLIKEDGRFGVVLQTAGLDRKVGVSASHRVAIVLGTINREAKAVEWTTSQTTLKNSESFVKIAGQTRLNETISIINDCPSSIGWEHDAVVLIRATNHLIGIKKRRTIEALRAFCAIASEEGSIHRKPGCIDSSDTSGLELLIPLLFPSTLEGTEPPPEISGSSSHYYIFLYADIPFHRVRFSGSSSGDRRVADMIDWADKFGKLRDAPLVPPDNPLLIVDRAFESLVKEEGNKHLQSGRANDALKGHLRWQAWSMVKESIKTDKLALKSNDQLFVNDSQWKRFVTEKAKIPTVWEKKSQKYCVP